MKARLVKIGNSRGVRLPKPLIEEAGLTDEVELRVEDGAIVIGSVLRPRAGWGPAAERAHREGDDALIGGASSTRFDEKEWSW